LSQYTLILSRYLIPVRPRGLVLENHGLVIEQDRVVAMLPGTEACAAYPDADVVEMPQHVLLPGLINAHTHSPMTLMRGFADDLDLQRWLNEHIWPAESRFVDREYVRDGARLAVAEMIQGGTTCFNEQYFFPDEIARVAGETGMRAVVGLPLLDQATFWARNFDEYLDKGLAVREAFEGEELVSFCLAPHAPYSVSDRGLQRISEVSGESGMRVTMHCLETAYDVKHSIGTYGIKPLERLSRLGLLNDALVAVHMTQLEEADCDRVAESGVHVVHCPQSNLKLASGICPVSQLINDGVNVSLGTDGAASNNNLDLLEEARFASLLAKGASGDATVVDAVQTVEMMTVSGARALGLENEIGTIETGKQADLCAIDLSSVQTRPLHNLFSQIAYAASSAQFSDVWIAGKRIMEDRNLLTLSEQEVLARADSWQIRMTDVPATRKAVP
jgi:5-methylthioadenosine/S-adenosylhomocysteine deaminase